MVELPYWIVPAAVLVVGSSPFAAVVFYLWRRRRKIFRLTRLDREILDSLVNRPFDWVESTITKQLQSTCYTNRWLTRTDGLAILIDAGGKWTKVKKPFDYRFHETMQGLINAAIKAIQAEAEPPKPVITGNMTVYNAEMTINAWQKKVANAKAILGE